MPYKTGTIDNVTEQRKCQFCKINLAILKYLQKSSIIINKAEKLRLNELLCGIEGAISMISLLSFVPVFSRGLKFHI